MMGVSTSTANVIAGAVSMGIMMAGSLIANGLAKSQGQISAASAETASPTYSINASGNIARIGQPEPEGFGRMQIVPDYVSQPWTSYENNEEWGHFIYALGRGEYDVHAMSYGDTIFWKDGKFVQSTIIVSSGDEVEPVINDEITSGYSNAYVITDEDSVASTVKVKIKFPNGIYSFKNEGDNRTKAVTIRIIAYFAKCDAAGNTTDGFTGITLHIGEEQMLQLAAIEANFPTPMYSPCLIQEGIR